MQNENKVSKKTKIICVVLVAALLIGGGIGLFYLLRKHSNFDTLNFDVRKGAIAQGIVENAQYTPDIDKFADSETTSNVRTTTETDETIMEVGSKEVFSKLIDEYATIETEAGAGKYGGYDIYEIKEEIAFVVKKVPAFNQWFRMPAMREKEGYSSIPYFELWAYYLELDEATNGLSITRVCWSTRSSYWDPNLGQEIEDHADGTSFGQFEVMKINYYTDENEKEVVETFMYAVGVDNLPENRFNPNPEDFYSFEYVYLKNVEDTYLVKYHIVSTPRLNVGMDIFNKKEYGVYRDFMIINYDGYTNIDITRINDSVIDGENDTNIKLLLESIGYEETLQTTDSEFTDKICKQIVDNFEIKNNWLKIYQESNESYKIDTIAGPHKDFMPVYNIHSRIDFVFGNNFYYNSSASIYDESIFDDNKLYSLSMALKSESGDIYIIGTNYIKVKNKNYIDSTQTYKVLESENSISKYDTTINIDKDGVYTLYTVLTVKNEDKDEIMFDTMEKVSVIRYAGFEIENTTDENGVTHTYKVSGTGRKLVVTVSTLAEND